MTSLDAWFDPELTAGGIAPPSLADLLRPGAA
jgi:hypothetical protein